MRFIWVTALVAVNVAFVVTGRRAPPRSSAFLPHLLLLCWLGWYQSRGGRCDTYYAHPNGSIGQMALEIAAFAVLGLALLPLVRGRSIRSIVGAMAAWNAVHVVVFHAWLEVTNHWTWAHTWLVCASLLALCALSVTASRSFEREARTPTVAL